MDKKSMVQSMKTHVKGAMMISQHQVETFMGIGRAKSCELLNGLDVFKMNDGRKYFIPDVVQRIMERTVR